MKKIAVAVLLLVAVPAFAASPFVAGVKGGTYKGKMTTYDNKTIDMTATVKNDGNVATFEVTSPDGKETWTLTEKKFDQKELGTNTQYGANATNPNATNEQTYNINCTADKKCDNGIDSRYSWTIKTGTDTLTVIGTGVPKDKWSDPTAKAEKRFEISWKLAK